MTEAVLLKGAVYLGHDHTYQKQQKSQQHYSRWFLWIKTLRKESPRGAYADARKT